MVGGALLGLYGLALVFLVFLIHMAGQKSFGVPYLAPLAPLVPGEMKDVISRAPKWNMHLRPSFIANRNLIRENTLPPGSSSDTKGKGENR